MLLEKRRHKRFKLDLIQLNGKLSPADTVEIIDLSFGGVALKVDRRLNVGRDYVFKLEENGNSIDVNGTVVRCKLSAIEERYIGGRVSIYTAGMRFPDSSSEQIADFIRNSVLT
jgi:hypothetical protein